MKNRMYTEQINYLREEGQWSNDLAGSMPLALATLLGGASENLLQ